MNMNIAEITVDDVSEEHFQRIVDSFKIIDPNNIVKSISIVSFLDHSKVVKENMKLKAKLKELKSNYESFKGDVLTNFELLDFCIAE